MSKSDDRALNNRPNTGGSGTEREQQIAYQFGGDYVITSSASAGAWVAASHPVDLAEAE